jgi:hypothetical protein
MRRFRSIIAQFRFAHRTIVVPQFPMFQQLGTLKESRVSHAIARAATA